MRTYGIARALALPAVGSTLLYVRFGADEPDAAFRAIPGIELHEVVPSRGAAAPARLRRGARMRGVPDAFARGISPELDARPRAAGRRAAAADG